VNQMRRVGSPSRAARARELWRSARGVIDLRWGGAPGNIAGVAPGSLDSGGAADQPHHNERQGCQAGP
jgi:hypothetical protein